MKTKKILFELSEELLASVDAARGTNARNPFLESLLWQSSAVKKAAKATGIKQPIRPTEGRGSWARVAKKAAAKKRKPAPKAKT